MKECSTKAAAEALGVHAIGGGCLEGEALMSVPTRPSRADGLTRATGRLQSP